MKIKPNNYAVWPSLFEANKKSHITVTATSPAFFPREGVQYQIRINSYDHAHMESHYISMDHFTVIDDVSTENGAWECDYEFGEEGEYSVCLVVNGVVFENVQIYVLESDLFSKRPLLGDFHSHSYRSDGKRCPMFQPANYREEGYDFFVLTDHNRYAPSIEASDAYEGVNIGIKVFRGEEVHTPGSGTHIVHFGGEKSVDDIYYKHPEEYEAGLVEARKKVPDCIPEIYRERYAKAVWATEKIHEVGGIAVYPHPFWIPAKANAYLGEAEFASLMLKSGMFDAFEVYGGVPHMGGNNLQECLYNDLRAEGYNISVVGSSDTHEVTDTFANVQTVVLADEFTDESIKKAIKDGNTVAVRWIGSGKEREFNVCGKFRLAEYVQYLLKYYFPTFKEIVSGEGKMMMQYLVGEISGEEIGCVSGRGEMFYKRFAGIMPAPLPSKAILEKEARWREVQMKSPDGCGTVLFPEKGITRKI